MTNCSSVHSDSAFTERVLGAPSENYKGYVEADLTQRARLVPSHSLYLLHGLADLTAPYTHGVAFAKALSEAGVIFRYQVRPTSDTFSEIVQLIDSPATYVEGISN